MRAALCTLLVVLAPAVARGQFPVPPRPCRGVECPPPGVGVVRTSSNVRVELADRVLRYEVTETFVNRGGTIGEADYLFPVPKGAAFQDLKLSIDGEMVAGETLGADEARRVYEDIVRRQRDPALVEWMGRGLLRTRIFPFRPGEERKIVVRYQAVAEREGDALRVDYFRGGALVGPGQGGIMMPRPRCPDVARCGTIGGAAGGDDAARVRDDGRARLTLVYPLGDGLGQAYSPTHELDAEEQGGRRVVRVLGDASDLALLVPIRRVRSEPSISVLAHAPGREAGFALITLSPPTTAARSTPRDVTLVIDVSGSMSAAKMAQARAAGKALLASLDPRDRFRLIDFATSVNTFRDEFVPATPLNIRAGERYLAALEAGGSTNISGALDEAMAPAETAGRMGVVLFITDGEPTVGERVPEAIAERAAKLRGHRRVFTFGLGADVNAPLLEQLALEGRGTAHFVRPEESTERAVSVVASRITNPVVTDLRLRGEGVRFTKMHPSGPVDVFAGQDLVILARYELVGEADRTRIRFEGETADGPVSWASVVELPERDRENAFVPRLWATQRVGYLSAEKRKSRGPTPELDAEIRELGEKYGIPTEFTSYFVREPGMVAQLRDAAQTAAPPPMVGRRGAVGNVQGQVGGGAVATAPVAAPANAPRDQAFEQARRSASMREAKSLAGMDSVAAGPAGEMTRRVGPRIFMLRDSVWTDARLKDGVASGLRVVKVKAFSPAYFDLVGRLPELKDVLALGDRVRVAGREVVIEVGREGAERLSAGELLQTVNGW